MPQHWICLAPNPVYCCALTAYYCSYDCLPLQGDTHVAWPEPTSIVTLSGRRKSVYICGRLLHASPSRISQLIQWQLLWPNNHTRTRLAALLSCIRPCLVRLETRATRSARLVEFSTSPACRLCHLQGQQPAPLLPDAGGDIECSSLYRVTVGTAILLRKAKGQYLLTCKVSWCCLLALHGSERTPMYVNSISSSDPHGSGGYVCDPWSTQRHTQGAWPCRLTYRPP